MAKAPRHQQLKKLTLISVASIAAMASFSACSTSTPSPAPTTSPGTSTTAEAGSCEVNPSSAPMPAAEPLEPVPADARISVALNGIPSGTVKPGDAPTEVDVTLCNDSPVDYPKVGVVFVINKCSCATSPIGLPQGTVERFDAATGSWIKLKHPIITTGMDYIGGFNDVQELPKGKTVTLKYRAALDASMIDGRGGVQATAVVPDPLVQIGKADLPFTVSKEPTTPPNGPRPTVLPFSDLTYPSGIAVSAAGDVYLTDTDSDRVLKLAAGSDEQTVLPFTGLKNPRGVGVDTAGNVYVTSADKVVKLPAESSQQTVLPFTGLQHPGSVAVDTAGNVYVTDYTVTDYTLSDTTVVKLAAGSNEQTVLPFSGNGAANSLAVDGSGSVYVDDRANNRVLKLAAGSADQVVLPLTGLEGSDGMAVDAAGDVYVIDGENRQVVKFAAGSNDPSPLPSFGLFAPQDVAVDGAGNVYVVDDSGFGQVVKLAAK
ncbi:NHL repeat-containing protein [Mycobacterium sp. URHB0044]|uniref:NHL repeat-containing protein n=1 Tax=Mycobacterium sp. URHB0044 TaxID=1380386 RepID=UPI0012DC3159|nr:NHL repeat-containing protein [Mycobacterium sp. URHB0044]